MQNVSKFTYSSCLRRPRTYSTAHIPYPKKSLLHVPSCFPSLPQEGHQSQSKILRNSNKQSRFRSPAGNRDQNRNRSIFNKPNTDRWLVFKQVGSRFSRFSSVFVFFADSLRHPFTSQTQIFEFVM
jgi:hypothetical protein